MALKPISFWIEKHPDSLHFRFLKEFVLKSIKIILENNISRKAIDTIFAPTHATLTMEYFEVHFYNIFEVK